MSKKVRVYTEKNRCPNSESQFIPTSNSWKRKEEIVEEVEKEHKGNRKKIKACGISIAKCINV